MVEAVGGYAIVKRGSRVPWDDIGPGWALKKCLRLREIQDRVETVFSEGLSRHFR